MSADLITAEQMRRLEQDEIRSGRVTGLDLMERAGQGAATVIAQRFPAGRVSVLCGPGNNGGDGFVIARSLAARGWAVTVWLLGQAVRLPPDARHNHDLWAGDHPVHPWAPAAIAATPADLVVDAVFGAGLTRGVGAEVLAAFDGGAPVVAIDAPSGLCMDSGRPLGAGAVRAALTVTFHLARPGHYLAEGPAHCGSVALVDIGLPKAATGTRLVGPPDPAATARDDAAHKYSHGHALILSGGAGATGAARLAARAALRAGAGLVTLGVPAEAMADAAAHLTSVMLRRLDDSRSLALALRDHRLTAWCLGPGLGLGRAEMAAAALASGRPGVLDADALTLLGADPRLQALLHRRIVLTPHGGEFARLAPDLAARLAAPPTTGPASSKLDAARDAAIRLGAVVLLKGADTVIAAPDGGCAIHAAAYDRRAPWLATAGAGDVLAGLITGLMARGLPPAPAAEAGAWRHVDAALAVGPGAIAEDLPDALMPR